MFPLARHFSFMAQTQHSHGICVSDIVFYLITWPQLCQRPRNCLEEVLEAF